MNAEYSSIEEAFNDIITKFGIFHYKFDKKNFVIIDDFLHTDILIKYHIDRDNYDCELPDRCELGRWRKDQIKLYNLHISFRVVGIKRMTNKALVAQGFESYD